MKTKRERPSLQLLLRVVLSTIVFLSLDLTCLTEVQEGKLPEPEALGVLYFLDVAANSLRPLERQIATVKTRGLIKGQVVAELKGEKSPIRLTPAQKPEFVVSLPNGVDPNKYRLFVLSPRKEKREVVIAEGTLTGSKSNPVMVSYNVTKFGGSSYKLTPAQPLPAGEYCFNPNDSNDAFCFAIDALKESVEKKSN